MAKDGFAISHSKGTIATPGDAQTNQIIYYGLVPSGGTATLYSDGSSTMIDVTPGRAIAFEIQMIAAQATSGDISFRKYQGAAKNLGSGVSIVGSITETTVAEDAHLVKITISGSGSLLTITASDLILAQPINVVCYIRYTETIAPGF